jgi:hypothetical protein
MNYAIDPYNSWQSLIEAAGRQTNTRCRLLIEEVRKHMEAEIKGQLEPLMATLTAQPVYHFWGNGEPLVLEGRDAVAAFYQGLFATGSQQFEVDLEKVLATEDHVITEGRVKQVYRGDALAVMGVPEVSGQAVTEDSLWLSNTQLMTLWPADAEGRLIGEDIYFGVNPMTTLVPVTAAELPPYYQL